ncbi:hypothetical protein [Streptomyces sp. RKAG293]|uniref:hypothetical protein n=1 Tax=Streptomyces sp. RKAG293 TaxID=2893403 RepID=UPI002033FF79|nr:hypothetical protein [Streptomyces sp. RKAG293]MCM2416597.1 hypothetical protein [Streptomyces sp. RKAG293]
MSLAFEDDPVVNWMFPKTLPKRHEDIDGFFRSYLTFITDHGGVVDATPNYEGIFVWIPPDAEKISEDSYKSFLEDLRSKSGVMGDRAVAVANALVEQEPAEVPDPHYHWAFCGIAPQFRGTGVFQTLIEPLARKSEDEGIGVYGEASSPLNLKLWQRTGFARIGEEITVPGGGPTFYPIYRLPTPSADQ